VLSFNFVYMYVMFNYRYLQIAVVLAKCNNGAIPFRRFAAFFSSSAILIVAQFGPKFSIIIPECLPIYSKGFKVTAVTVSRNTTNKQRNIHHASKNTTTAVSMKRCNSCKINSCDVFLSMTHKYADFIKRNRSI